MYFKGRYFHELRGTHEDNDWECVEMHWKAVIE